MRHRPDDVLRAERGVAAEEHAGTRRRHGDLVDHGHAPLVELDADVALDPRKGVFLADRHQHVIARKVDVGLARRHELATTLRVALRRDFFEHDARQLSALVRQSTSARGSCESECLRARRLPFPRARPSFRRSRTGPPPVRPRRPGASRCGSSPLPCCHRPARRRACRFSSCGRTTRSTANRCRYGCWPRLPCVQARRGRARAARRCRRRRRPTLQQAGL